MYTFRNLLAGTCLLLLTAMPVLAQTSPLVDLQQRIDSLSTVKTTLLHQINSIEEEVDALESALRMRQVEQLESAELVLMTNMEASLRTQPSPGARVLRVVPEKTPMAALDYDGAYWKVRHLGVEGWIMRLFVDEGEGSEAFKESLALNRREARPSPPRHVDRKQERAGKDFLVTTFGMHPPNTAGGVSVYYAFEHLDSTRTIREVTFSITPYNLEGEVEKGTNTGVSTKRLRRFGPISVYDGERQYQFENIWYNERIHCAQIDRIDIVYTDGSRTTHIRDLDTVMSASIVNECTMTAANRLDPPATSN